MRLLRGVQATRCLSSQTVATIGNFDGLHRGHQALLKALKHAAARQNLPTLVVLFEPQPHEYFQGDNAKARLTSLREKLLLLSQLGIDYACCLSFNHTLSKMTANTFAKEIIFSKLQVKELLIGEDFRFGAGREGNVALLTDIAKAVGAGVVVYPEVLFERTRVSSTRIRAALHESQFELAQTLLGRPYSLSGRVMKGDALGRTFGVPTANLKLSRITPPMVGVFCVEVKRADGRVYRGVANLGKRPTVKGLTYRLEVHLFDFDKSLYGEVLEVFFLHRLRGELKFPSLEALIKQIKADIAQARALFSGLNRVLT